MSWQIHCFINTVEINEKTANDLLKTLKNIDSELYTEVSNFVFNKNLYFISDYGEHQNYVSNIAVQKTLMKNKAKGIIGFADFEGSSSITLYVFDGTGHMKLLQKDFSDEEELRESFPEINGFLLKETEKIV